MLKAWIRASLRALQFMKQNPVETAEIAARELNLDRDLARRALNLTLPAMSDDDPGGFAERGLVLNTQTAMDLLGITGNPAELGKNAHDLSLLRQVQRELGIRCVSGYQCP
jgi:ABC-type nitrate/sulfonate/bicarbonate transport system substrate-binding protein